MAQMSSEMHLCWSYVAADLDEDTEYQELGGIIPHPHPENRQQ